MRFFVLDATLLNFNNLEHTDWPKKANVPKLRRAKVRI